MRIRVVTWLALALALACGGETEPPSARELLTIRTLGLAYLEENDLPAAEQEFLKLTRLAPNEPLGFANLGLVYLRQGRFEEAEREIARATRLGPADAEIRLMLAKVFELTDRRAEAERELLSALETDSTNPKALYALAHLADEASDAVARTRYLARLVRAAPANLPARLELAEVLLQRGQVDSAAQQLEDIRRQVPELPPQSTDFFDRALRFARAGDAAQAGTPTAMFHNVLRVTPAYQAGLVDVRGPGGALIGLPLVTFSPNITLDTQDPEEVLAALSFTDVTELIGLGGIDGGSTAVAAADYDGDGDNDVVVVWPTGARFFRSDGVGYSDATSASGLREARGTFALFADYDNDGRLDLFIGGDSEVRLYQQTSDGTFRDRTRSSGIAGFQGQRSAVFVDADHDGDLDLFVVGASGSRMYRNNLDGSFAEVSGRWGLSLGSGSGVGFADFDNDDDIDLVVARPDAPAVWFANLRGGRFEQRLLGPDPGVVGTALAVGDYDNDGFFDVLVAGSAEAHLLRNRGDGTFERDPRPSTLLDAMRRVDVRGLQFFDLDNDGWLDVAVASRGARDASLQLFRNAAPGRFDDVTSMLQNAAAAATGLTVLDYDGDGDLDLVLGRTADGVQVFRNNGGNANHFVTVRLVGLGAGSGKNNHFGVGAKLEMRAGQLYQARVATGPVTHFGLGSRLKADVLRILWTNGVPQNLFYPGGDQDLVEEQILKGSCAFLYTWDGQRFVFVKDVLWRSALGMPVGIMAGGDQAYAPAFPSQEYIRVPGELLVARNGKYEIRLTEELWEVAYLDEVKLIAVDHPRDVDVFVNERFVPPEPATLRLHEVRERRALRTATHRGADVTAALAAADHMYVSDLVPTRYQGLTDPHDLVLDLGDLRTDDSVFLYLRGWIFPTDASINVAVAQNRTMTPLAPSLAVPDGHGGWRTIIADLGFPAGKDKTVIADLTGRLAPGDPRVRIRTNMEIYWDHAFVSLGGTAGSTRLTSLSPVEADLRSRGFSRMYRAGGRHGPHWFDYSHVTTESPWTVIEGAFTRYGDVRHLLRAADDFTVVMAPGDEVAVAFDAASLPPLPDGWTRDFLLYSDGWIKDADLNTATGNTVEPMPFRAMQQYPPGANEGFPTGNDAERYLAEYQTRVVRRR